MRITRHLLIWPLIMLGVVVPAVLLKPASVQYAAALGDLASTTTPSYVYAGVPFVVRDSYGTQICVSTRAGQPLPPFVVPAGQNGAGWATGGTGTVQAGVPFVVQDHNGTQVCISTRGGQSLPPFIAP